MYKFEIRYICSPLKGDPFPCYQNHRDLDKSIGFFLSHRDVAQPGSALAWGARGREFESRHPDQSVQGFQTSGSLVCF